MKGNFLPLKDKFGPFGLKGKGPVFGQPGEKQVWFGSNCPRRLEGAIWKSMAAILIGVSCGLEVAL
jgi:hypothetical protein